MLARLGKGIDPASKSLLVPPFVPLQGLAFQGWAVFRKN